ncbi:hypothetical protein JCM10908_003899 [Rhodotorula pacifica]|uniref:negative cofactor 2 transcription regulator complex subunit BUR6 n=1 Tax=Rhodotorula pacifica TaxID=1495444 RepID=UPI003182231A
MAKKSNQARFPLARIKKMIQQDEDVGKVASATPVVVSKALELFLASLVNSCVKDAESRGSTKLTPYGLKRAVNTTAMLDFCADIVESIPDPLEGEEDNDDSPEGGKKKRGGGGGGGGGKKRAGGAEGGAKKRASRKSKKNDEDDEEDDESDEFDGADDDEDGAAAASGSSKGAKRQKSSARGDDDDDDYEE